MNDWVRTSTAVDGFAGFFDLADATETARNSGKLKTPGPDGQGAVISADRIHLNAAGNRMLRDSGALNPLRFSRAASPQS